MAPHATLLRSRLASPAHAPLAGQLHPSDGQFGNWALACERHVVSAWPIRDTISVVESRTCRDWVPCPFDTLTIRRAQSPPEP